MWLVRLHTTCAHACVLVLVQLAWRSPARVTRVLTAGFPMPTGQPTSIGTTLHQTNAHNFLFSLLCFGLVIATLYITH